MLLPTIASLLALSSSLVAAKPEGASSLAGLATWGSQLVQGGRNGIAPPDGPYWSWSSCGGPDDAVLVDDIQIFPDPPVPGKNLTVIASGLVVERIEEGAYADVLVKLGLIKLLQKRFDICEEAENANATIQCPVAPGTYTVEQTVELPKEIPRAKFNIDVRGFTAEDDDMLCLKLSIDFLHRPKEDV